MKWYDRASIINAYTGGGELSAVSRGKSGTSYEAEDDKLFNIAGMESDIINETNMFPNN